MKTRLAALIALFVGILSAQLEMNYSYEMKYGDGKQVTGVASDDPDTSVYSYVENILDVNTYFGENFYFYTQFEYSNPPIYGYNRTVAKDMFNTYVAEYSGNQFMFKYGHIQTLYGYGLTLNMFQDQTTDFDNRVKGIEFKYMPHNLMEFFYVSGSGEYGMKSSGASRYNDLIFDLKP